MTGGGEEVLSVKIDLNAFKGLQFGLVNIFPFR